MDETIEFADANLDDVRLSTLQKISESNQNKDILPKIESIDTIGKKYLEENKKEIKKSNRNYSEENEENTDEILIEKKKEQNKKPNNFSDNYISVFSVFLVQSLTSLLFYYVCYLLKFDTDIIILRFIPFIIMVILIIIAWFFCNSKFYSKHEKLSTYALFFIINLCKIFFDVLSYLYIVSNKDHDGIDFSHFEARAYWKISMSLFYLIFIFYVYFSKDQTSFDICAYISIGSICVFLCFFLVLFSQKENDNMFRAINYFLYPFLEVFLLMFFIYPENSYLKFLRFIKVTIDWKVNRIDFFRFGFFIVPLIIKIITSCSNKCGCCRKNK